MKAQHTPGPWRMYKRMAGKCMVEVSGMELRSVIAQVHDNELCPEHGGNYEANARLIASAPALYEALKRLSDHLDARDAAHYHGSTDIVKQARAAIAAAEGRE